MTAAVAAAITTTMTAAVAAAAIATAKGSLGRSSRGLASLTTKVRPL